QHKGRAPKLDDDAGATAGQVFAGAQVEGNVGPAPVINQQLHGDKGFGLGIGRYAGFTAIRRRTFAVHNALAVLAAHGPDKYIFGTHGLDGMQNLGLFVADRIGTEGHGRFHRGEADELHDVVGHHVPQRAGFVVVTAALLYTYGFRHGNLDVINVAPVPDGLEDSVGEAQRQNILYGLLSQIVINAIDLLFARHPQQLLVQQPGGLEIVPKRFFDDHAPPMLFVFLHQPDFGEVLHAGAEKISGRRQIVHVIAVGRVLVVDLFERILQLEIKVFVAHVSTLIVQAANERLPDIGIHFVSGEFLDVFRDFLAEFLVRHGGAGHANHPEFPRQQVVFRQVVESRNQLAAGQIATGAKNHHGARVGYLANPWRLCCGHCFTQGHMYANRSRLEGGPRCRWRIAKTRSLANIKSFL